ncbi:MAG: M20/M25/M40 family metallo-hydrolase, partial [Firmicutes bacterium]|nr:M20/M25/M40 family metallo-hydrolase [Bacillota bacterium]
MSRPVDFARLKEDIQKTLFDYVAADTVTDSEHEHKVGAFFEQRIGSLPYFKEHPEYWGMYPIPNDYRGRHVCWSMVKGKGNRTVVLIHHYDVVPVEDFKTLKDYAFKPVELKEKLEEIAETLPEDACKDLKDGGWFFGRGVCDMKGGGSIQYSLLTQYSEDPDFEGNVIVIGVPDEENLSAGMRGAILLLNELKDKYGLEYEFMFNSEPHQRKDFSKAVFSCGSIGKLMPFVYIRGFLAHVGKSFEGINPVGIMGDVVSGLELNMDLADAYAGECAPGPTWLYLKDSKISYDVSMPLNMYGCLSVLTLIQS